MSDFLDNLIDRHSDAMPQIMPRLPSLFEPEVTRGGWNAAVPDNNVPEMEETNVPPSTQIVGPTDLGAVIEPIQHKAAPAPPVPANEERPSAKAVLSEPVFSLLLQETSRPSPFLHRDEEGVREVDATMEPLTPTLSSSPATPFSPTVGRVRHAHQQMRLEHKSPDFEATTEEHTSVAEHMNKPIFFLPPRESPVRESDLTSEHLTLSEREKRRTQGLLTPSTAPIAPIIPSVAGPERPMSRPEPVINVTIGRIEVRATVSQQKQTPKSESRTPVMSLEEYLRRRSGEQDQ